MVANSAFQRWAAEFPLTRPLARRNGRALFDLCAGFVHTQVLLAFVRLQLAEQLAEDAQSVAQIATRTSLPVDAASRLMEAAAALRLAEQDAQGRFVLGVLGAALLGNPGIAEMIEHNALLYGDLHDPIALLQAPERATDLRRYWPYSGRARPADLSAEEAGRYTNLMAASLPLLAGDVLAAYPFRRHRHVLDVGGGDGTFVALAARAAPDVRFTLFDLPVVAARARARFAQSGIAHRAQACEGDFRNGTLPAGADLVTLVRVIHDHDDTTALAILRAANSALPRGGTVLIAEPMSATRGSASVAAYFALYLFAMGNGRLRRADEIASLLRQAGFARVRQHATARPMLVRVLTAYRKY